MTGYISPQSASSPITANLRRDEIVSLQTTDNNSTQQQRVLQIGGAIPLVFGVYEPSTDTGGVWLTPPAARYGIQYDESSDDFFSFGLIISDGEVPRISISDIYKGALSFNTLLSPSVSTTFGGLATVGFDYSLTYLQAGSPTVGTPGSYTVSTLSSFLPRGSSSPPDVVFPPFGGLLHYKKTINSTGLQILSFGSDVAVADNFTVGVFDFNNQPIQLTVDFWAGNTLIQAVSTRNSFELYELTSVGTQIPQGSGPLLATFTLPEAANVYYRLSWKEWIYSAPSPDYVAGTPPINSTLALFPGSGGTFSGMTTLAVTGGYVNGTDQSYPPQQIRCFVRNGVIVDKVLGGRESSSSFVDLAYYLLKRTGSVVEQLIDLPSFEIAATFNQQIGLPFNGVLSNSVNLRDYLTSVSQYYLLRFVQAGGKYMLKPLLPLTADGSIETGTITPVATFSSANIVAGSYSKQYTPTDSLRPFCALMSWRSQTSAVFSQSQVTEVRYEGFAVDGPFEQYDMDEFCTDSRHAEAIGTYIISTRRYVTNTVSFQTTSNSSGLLPTDVIEVVWSYESQGVTKETTDLYQVDSIFEDQQGVYRIEATHFPTDSTGRSLVALDVQNVLLTALPALEAPLLGLQASFFDFEDGESQPGVFDLDTRSTLQAFSGGKSAETAFAYPDIKFTNAFPDPNAFYYMWSWRSYNSGSFQYHTFFGIRDVANGAGFDIRTAGSTNILFVGSGGPQVIGTDTSVANSWNHYFVQINWVNGNQDRPEISLWINGALVANVVISPSTPYSPPAGTNAALGDFRVARDGNTIGGTKYYDYCFGGTADTPLVPMNQPTIVPADIEAQLDAAAPDPVAAATKFSFEFSEAQIGVYGVSQRVSTQAFDGVISARTNSLTRGIEIFFQNAFLFPELSYYSWSIRIYNELSTDPVPVIAPLFTIAGQRSSNGFDFYGPGWMLQTAPSVDNTTTVQLYFNNLTKEALGSITIPAEQWNHYYVQLYWPNGTDNAPVVSLWFNGTLVGTSTITSNYSPPSGSFGPAPITKADFQTPTLFYNSAVANRALVYYDYCFGATLENPLVAMNAPTINPSAIEAALFGLTS